jgi:hypothetical protein
MHLRSVDVEQPAVPRSRNHNPALAAIRLFTEAAIVAFAFRG